MAKSSPNPRLPDAVTAVAAAFTALAIAGSIAWILQFGPVDDAYISLRYAVHWAGGQGLCFNPGERVEGFTSFLWVALLALATRAGLDPETAMSVLGWTSLAALAFATAHFARRHLAGLPAWGAYGLAVAACASVAVVGWAASGMESCLVGALLLGAADVALGRTSPGAPAAAAGLLALAAATRPEAAALAPAIALGVWLARRSAGGLARFAVGFALVFGAYWAGRWAYFGYPFPNTFYAKLDYGTLPLLTRGAMYVVRFAAAAWPLAIPALAAMALACARGAPAWVRTLAALVGLHVAVVVYEGGDHFALFRFLVPIVPALGLLAWHSVGAAFARLGGPAAGAAATAIALVGVSGATVGLPEHRDGIGMTHHRRLALEAELAADWSATGRWLGAQLPPGASVSLIAIGAVGYHSGMRIVDPHGLVDPVIAHRDMPLGEGYAGHEKFDVERVLAQRPDVVMLINLPTPDPVPEYALPGLMWGDYNAEMLRHPAFRRDYRYQPVAMAPGRFLNLHFRR